MINQAIIVALLAFSTGLLFYAALLLDENIELKEKLETIQESRSDELLEVPGDGKIHTGR